MKTLVKTACAYILQLVQLNPAWGSAALRTTTVLSTTLAATISASTPVLRMILARPSPHVEFSTIIPCAPVPMASWEMQILNAGHVSIRNSSVEDNVKPF